LSLAKRLREIGIFVALWLTSLALNFVGLEVATGFPAIIMRLAGIFGTTLAINSFILLMHEGMHSILFSNCKLNRWVSVALGLNFCMSFTAYQIYGTAVQRRKILQEYAILIALYLIAFLSIPRRFVIWMWLVPLLGAAYLTAVRGLSQHGVTDPRDPYLASRSIQASRIVKLFMLHENYHLEHHLFPEIPSYHLQAAHQQIAPHLPRSVTMNSDSGFLWRFFIQSLRMDETPIGLNPPPRHG
jgi:fatty acid desaturase